MKNKAQVSILGLMLATAVIVMALGIAYSVWQGSQSAYTSMDCTNSSISDYTKAACYTTDISPFIFIGILIAIGGALTIAKLISWIKNLKQEDYSLQS